MLLYCSQCGQKLEGRYCFNCGTPGRVSSIIVKLAVTVIIVASLVLGVLLFTGGGPETVAREFIQAVEKNDLNLLKQTLDPIYLENQDPDYLNAMISNFLANVRYNWQGRDGSVSIVGSQITGNQAEVTVRIQGAYTTESNLFLVQRGKKWYVDSRFYMFGN